MSRAGIRVAQAVGLPLLLLALWWALAASTESYYVSSPSEVASAFAETWLGSRLVDDLMPSVLRLFAGYVLAVLIGIALGVPIGLSARLRATVEPVLEFFRAIPPPVLVPLLILLSGVGDRMKVLVIVSGCVWPILLNTVEGVRALDPQLVETCRSYRIGGVDRLRHLVLRGASPQIMAGMRQSLSIAIILMVISEMFASSSGLGFTIVQFQRSFAIPEMWGGVVLLGLLGFVLSLGFARWERHVLGWYLGLRRSERGGA